MKPLGPSLVLTLLGLTWRMCFPGQPLNQARVEAPSPVSPREDPADFSGFWESPPALMVIIQEGARVRGAYQHYVWSRLFEGAVEGRTVTLHDPAREGAGQFKLSQDGDSLEGTLPGSQGGRSSWKRTGFAGAGTATIMVEGLTQERLDLRTATLRLAQSLGGDQAGSVQKLSELLKDPDPMNRAGACTALARLGELAKEAVPALSTLMKDKDSKVGLCAANALASIGSAAVPQLIRELSDDDPQARRYAVYALGHLGSEARDAVAALTKLLNNASLKEDAQKALDRIDPRQDLGKVAPGSGTWPQWRGPNRDNISRETGLLKEWPQGGPPVVWQVQGLGMGIAAVAVAEGRLFTVGYIGDSEYLTALEVATGRRLWAARLGPSVGESALMRWLGQRTPTIDGDRVYAFHVSGRLACFNAATGAEVWRKDYVADFGAMRYTWGYFDLPLVDGEALICTPGGLRATMVALDKRTGRVLWTGQVPTPTPAAHAGVVVSEGGGVRQYVAFIHGELVSLRALDGKFLWSYGPFGRTGYSHTPIVRGDSILATAGYATPIADLRLSSSYDGITVDERHLFQKTLNPFQDSSLVLGSRLYCLGGNSDFCLDLDTWKAAWGPRQMDSRGNCSVTYADGRFYFLYSRGDVVLAQATPSGVVETSTFHFPDYERTSGATNPVIAGGRMYLRHEHRLFCYDIREDALRGERAKSEVIVLENPGRALRKGDPVPQAVFVATPQDVVSKMLQVSGIKEGEELCDLGSGDGRIVIAAANRSAKAVGYEIDEDLVKQSRQKIEAANLGRLARVEQKDLFEADLSTADVVALYLPETYLERLIPRLAKLKPGARIVSHQFKIPGIAPDSTVSLQSSEDGDIHMIYRWTAPLKLPKD